MVAVIVWRIGDVVYVLYQHLVEPPFLLLSISDILATFGAFLVVLIAIEILVTITLYLKTDIIPAMLIILSVVGAVARTGLSGFFMGNGRKYSQPT